MKHLDESRRYIRYKRGIKMRKVISVFFVLYLFINFSFIQTSMALSCAPPRPNQDEFRDSSIVFVGTANNSNTDKAVVNFRVKTIWKGNTDNIQKGIFVSNMWMEIKEGQDYLIYANERDGQLEANLCGNSMLWTNVNQEQLNENFGIGQIIEQQANEKRQMNMNLFWLLSGVFVVLGGMIVILWNRKRYQK
jgi:hypothetical protein